MLGLLVSIGVLVNTVLAIPPERAAEFGYPAGVDVWSVPLTLQTLPSLTKLRCGKAYRAR